MAETAITTVLSKLGELATQEAEVLLQVGDDVMLMHDQLEWLQAVIRDEDRRRRAGTDGLTIVWVRQMRDVSFEAEDALDDFFHNHKVPPDLGGQGYDLSWKTWPMSFTGLWSQITVRHRLSGQIKVIISRLHKISEIKRSYNIEYKPSRTWMPSVTADAPRDCKKQTVDQDDDEKTLLEKLLPLQVDESPKMVVSVLGESGSGKNTLVGGWLSSKLPSEMKLIWYNMPPGTSPKDLLKQVLKQVKRGNADYPEGTDIAAKLHGFLSGIRYLVVLSGISSTTMLNCVWHSLPDDKNGSRVVLIMESDAYGDEVALHADTLNVNTGGKSTTLRLSRWDKEKSWRIFSQRVLDAQRKSADDDNYDYKKKVYGITGGHPLSIEVLAGLLRHKEKPVEWQALLEHLSPPSSSDSNDKLPTTMRIGIERIFCASYDDLPQDLKSCFLYFAAYPKNIGEHVDQVVRMWAAEGFIKPRHGKTLEQVGHMYLDNLVSRGLVRRKQKVLVIVHSRLLEFLQLEALQASFIEVHYRNDILAPASVRRLSIQDDGYGYTPLTTKFPKLRSFICRVKDEEEGQSSSETDGQISRSCWSSMLSCVPFLVTEGGGGGAGGGGEGGGGHGHDLDFLRGSKFIRVISVSGLRIKELPNEIGDMMHLRYLRVDSKGLQVLPSSIKRLLNLQTLDLTNTQVEEIDEEFWEIKALRHVLAERLTLPVSIKKELGNLQTLHGVNPGQGEWDEHDCPLHNMAHLRSLGLNGVQDGKHGKALASALKSMDLLGHLTLQGDVIPSCVFTEPNLRCLETMVLYGEVKTDEFPPDLDIRHVRPNLVDLKPDALKGLGLKGLDRLFKK